MGLEPLPKEAEYGIRQPDVTKRMMEAWNWLERQGVLIRNDEQTADWFIISSDGERLLKSGSLAVQQNEVTIIHRIKRIAYAKRTDILLI